MKKTHKCCKCEAEFYASYKGLYYCPIHLEEALAKEKKATKEKIESLTLKNH